MRPLVYIVTIVEIAIVAILVVVEKLASKVQMVEEARISRGDSKPTSTDQPIDEQI